MAAATVRGGAAAAAETPRDWGEQSPGGGGGAKTKTNVLRLIRSWPWYHQLFVMVALVQAVVQTFERITLLSTKAPAWEGYADESNPDHLDKQAILRQSIWFFGIITASAWFCCYYAVHSVLAVNSFELFTFFGTSLALIVRLAVEFANTEDECTGTDNSHLCLGFFVGSLFLCIVGMALTVWMHTDLVWKRYKAIGSNVTTRGMYRQFELFQAVQKMDVQFSLMTLFTGIVFFSSLDTPTTKVAMGLNIILFAVEIVWEWLGNYSVRQEHAFSMYIFWATSTLLPAFLVNIAIDYARHGELLRDASTTSVRATIFVFAAVAIINRIVTVITSISLYRSFDTDGYVGLRRILDGKLQVFDRARVTTASTALGGTGRVASGVGMGVELRTPSKLPAAAAAGGGGGAGGTGDGSAPSSARTSAVLTAVGAANAARAAAVAAAAAAAAAPPAAPIEMRLNPFHAAAVGLKTSDTIAVGATDKDGAAALPPTNHRPSRGSGVSAAAAAGAADSVAVGVAINPLATGGAYGSESSRAMGVEDDEEDDGLGQEHDFAAALYTTV